MKDEERWQKRTNTYEPQNLIVDTIRWQRMTAHYCA